MGFLLRGPIDWKDVFSRAEVIAKNTNGAPWPVMCQAIIEAVNFHFDLLRTDLMTLKNEVIKIASGEASDERYHQLAGRIEAYGKYVIDQAAKAPRAVTDMTGQRAARRTCYCGSPIDDGNFEMWTCPCGLVTDMRRGIRVWR